jgi:hypothetical protein
MVLLHGTLEVHIHEATDLPLTAANQVILDATANIPTVASFPVLKWSR